MNDTAPERLLVRAPNWLGDCVMALPTLAALRRSLPRTTLAVACREGLDACFRSDPTVDEVRIVPGASRSLAGAKALWRDARTLRAARFDAGLLLTNSLSTAVWLWAAGVPERLGYPRDGRRFFLTACEPVTPEVRALHQSEYYLRLAGLLGVDGPAALPKLHVPPEGAASARRLLAAKDVEGGYAVFAPVSGFGAVKDWPEGRYAHLARRVAETLRLPVLLCGTSAQEPACQRIAAEAGSSAVMSVAGLTDLAGFLGLLEGASLFVGGDSGGAHAAAAFGKPTVAIFGITEPSRTRPLGPRVTCVGAGGLETPRLRSPAVREAARRELEAVSVEEVWTALTRVDRVEAAT